MPRALIFSLLAFSGCSHLPDFIQPGEKTSWTVGILVYNGVYNTEFIAPMDVFEHLNAGGSAKVEVYLIGPSARTVTSAEGLQFKPDRSFSNHPTIDILVIPSFKNYESDLGSQPRVIEWIQDTAEDATYVLSNCWGAFFLAKAGLLDGREAMTYPPDIDKLQEQFPRIRTVKGMTFVRDGKFITGGGGVASYDNALYVVQEIWGAKTAREIASGLVKAWDLGSVRHRIARK